MDVNSLTNFFVPIIIILIFIAIIASIIASIKKLFG